MPTVAALQPPRVRYGSVLREFRVRVRVVPLERCAEAAGCRGFTEGRGWSRRSVGPRQEYLERIEDPPLGVRAVNIQPGRWWNLGDEARAQAVVALLWEFAEEEDRAWLREVARG